MAMTLRSNGQESRELTEILDGEGGNTQRFDAGLANEVLIRQNAAIKWGSVTRALANRPQSWGEVSSRLIPMTHDPQPHDVMLARVQQMERHSRIELDSGRRALFYVGDLLAVAFGWRYATQQFFGDVPPLQPVYHMLSQGGVCGRVISAPDRFSDPTLLEPLGYLSDDDGKITNLRRHGIKELPNTPRVQTILVIGSSMDSGKTTMASNIIHGLTLAGNRVHAGKITGTACVKDVSRMQDSGAAKVLDFSQAGFASTAQASEEELFSGCKAIMSHLSADQPDYVVLEIADGIVQRETQMLLRFLTEEQLVDHVCLAVHDAMAGPTCLNLLHKKWGILPKVVSGAATVSPLSTDELRVMVPLPCLRTEDLIDPSVEKLFAAEELFTPGGWLKEQSVQ